MSNEEVNQTIFVVFIISFVTLFTIVFSYLISSILSASVLKKMGEPSWKGWIPVYNMWILFEHGGMYGWLVMLNFIPAFVGGVASSFMSNNHTILVTAIVFTSVTVLVNITYTVLSLIVVNRINKGFRKGKGFTVLYFFIPFLWFAILGFGSSSYSPSQNLKDRVLARHIAKRVASTPTEPISHVTHASSTL